MGCQNKESNISFNLNIKPGSSFWLAVVFLIVVAAFAVGCSPRLGATIGLPQIPPVGTVQTLQNGSGHSSVFVNLVRDSRPTQAIAELDGKQTEAASSISPSIQDAMQRAFQKSGFSLSEDAPVVVSSEVREWIAQVEGGVPSRAHAETKLYIEVLDPANKKIYTGTYQGLADIKGTSLGERDIQRVLGASMSEAIEQIVNDTQLVTLLSSF